METEKTYCGSGKVITTNFGTLTKISFSKKDLETLMSKLNDKGWVNTVLKEKRDKQEGKPTHYLMVDNYTPKNNAAF